MRLPDRLRAVSPHAAACIAVAMAIVVLLVAVYMSARKTRAEPARKTRAEPARKTRAEPARKTRAEPARSTRAVPARGREGLERGGPPPGRAADYDPEDFGMDAPAAPDRAPPAEEPDPEESWDRQLREEIGGVPRHALGTSPPEQQLRMSRVPAPSPGAPSRIYQTEYDHPGADIGDA